MTINSSGKWNAGLILCVFIVLFLVITDHVAASDGPVMSDKAAGTAVGEGDNGDSGSGSGSGTLLPDLFTGSMRYSIPIDVAPGRKGMQPDLALTYRSNKGNGWVGVGWDLDVMAIERRLKGLTYDDNVDTYILRMAGAAIDLIYDNAAGYYRARIENDFYKIQKISSGQVFYWQLIDKTGRKHLFGQTAASRQDDPKPDANKIFKWCLDHVEDTNGNYMDYLYVKQVNGQPYQGQIYLDQIKYTGNTADGTGTTNHVKFYLEERSDAPNMYTTYFLVQTRYRLKTIDINAHGNRVRTYSLAYDADQTASGNQYSSATGRSLLTSVKQFDKNAAVATDGTITGGSSLPPILLAYQFDTPSFTDKGIWHNNWCVGSKMWMKTLDFEGNGITDIYCHDWTTNSTAVSLSNGASAFTDLSTNMVNACAGGWRQIGTGYFNANGKEDFYCFWPSTGTANVTLSTGNGFEADNQWVSQWGTNHWPEIGDFNGDGMTDLVSWEKAVYSYPYASPATGETYVALSNGDGGFTVGNNSGLWLNNWCTGSYGRLVRGDFNGDGKTDLLCHNKPGNYLPAVKNEVALSNGIDGFTLGANRGLWLDNWCNTNYPDYASLNVGDFNGDGMTDLICSYPYTGKTNVALSNGVDGFVVGNNGGLWRSNWCVNGQLGLADFNNDGMMDIYCAPTEAGVGKVYVALSNGKDAFVDGANGSLWINNWCGYAGHKTWTGDFNGDGNTDLLCTVPNTGGNVYIALSGSLNVRNDLLSSVSNGLGGNTSISYKSSTQYVNTQLPFSVSTLSSLTTCDNYDKVSASCKGVSSTTKYEYSGGFYHIAERDFRGFNDVKVTGPMGSNGAQKVTETWFHQGNGATKPSVILCKPNGYCPPPAQAADVPVGYMKGKPYHTQVRDSFGNIYTDTTINYLSNTLTNGAYFTPPNTSTSFFCNGDSTTVCDGVTSGQSKVMRYSYDSYGNGIQEEIYDSANAAAPYRTTIRTFTTESADNYLVGLPKTETIYEGAASGLVASSSKFYYDDPSDCSSLSRSKNQLPTKGNVTTISRLLRDKPGDAETFLEVNNSYDPYGNPACTRDPKGYVYRTSYDNDAHIYATTRTNPKGHVTTTEYYAVDSVLPGAGLYGQVKRVIDPNGAVMTTEYDTFGRPTKIMDPYGAGAAYGTQVISYENFGTVGQQKVVTYTAVDYATSATVWSESYFDGFNRTTKTRAQGPDSNVIRTDTTYDAHGAVAASSLPYFEGLESARLKSFTYDPMGRVIEAKNPDSTTLQACYQNGVTVKLDPDGRRKRQTTDVFGRLVQVNEYNSGVAFTSCTTELGAAYATTTYQYDVMGNLRLVTDAESNQTEMRYDTLGRKIFMHDPDMSGPGGKDWKYAYDANGNLISQTDAKNQAIGFTYDEMNRVKLKDYPTGTDVTYTYDVAPDGTATNPIGRLSTMTDASGSTKYYYDKLGRATKTVKTVDNTSYAFTSSYNALGKPTSITYPYPDTETVSYEYNGGGLLSQVTGSGVNYATYKNYNALGQPGAITYGNGIATNYTYEPLTNRLQSIITGNTVQTLINLAYTYYDAGSVKDIVNNSDSSRTQSFQYDGLNRLQQAQSSSYGGNGVLWYDYSPIGNIKLKEGVTYDYTGLKPHAVKSTLSGTTYTYYSYDDNGNMTSDGIRTLTYDYDNMPQSITVNNKTTNFVYDGAGARVKKSSPDGDYVYLGKLYECKEGVCSKYIFAGETRLASKSGTDVLYYHQDHLGSTLAVSNTHGAQEYSCSSQSVRIAGATPRYFTTIQAAYNAAVDGDVIQTRAETFVENLDLSRNISITISGGYDCSYTTRMQNTQLVGMVSDNAGTLTIESFDIVINGDALKKVEDVQYLPFGETRGDAGYITVNHKYTSQELDAETGLYYYGARYYNQVLGRFISPDTIVSDYTKPQALNRYSYAMNNPLYYTDPTGNYTVDGVEPFDYGDFGLGDGGYSGGYSDGFSSSGYAGGYDFGIPSTASQSFYNGQYGDLSALGSNSNYLASGSHGAYSYTVFVDQPVAGTDKVRNWTNVGHTWFLLGVSASDMNSIPEDLREYVNTPIGYYSDGLHKNDYAHFDSLDVVRTTDVTNRDSFINGLKTVQGLDSQKDIYGLCAFNCTNVTLMVGDVVGVPYPNFQSSGWFGCSQGSAPGPFGFYLNQLP